MSTYRSFLNQLEKIAYKGPSFPKNFNMHLLVPNPVTPPTPTLFPPKPFSLNNKIPLPTVLTRHLVKPQQNLETMTNQGKVLGFRIEVKGRRGTRSSRQVVLYGKLNMGLTNGINGSKVDFGRSVFITKRGSNGVKVYIQYG